MLYERIIKKIKFHIKNKWKKIKLKPISVDMLVADTAWTGHFSPEHIPFSLTPGLTMEPRLALNSQYCCLNFPREEITSLYCHARFSLCCFLYCFYVETASSCVGLNLLNWGSNNPPCSASHIAALSLHFHSQTPLRDFYLRCQGK